MGAFTVQAGNGDNFAKSTAKATADELAATDYFVVQRAASGPAVGDIEIGGDIYVTVKDDAGARKIRMAPIGNELREVPTLVRRVNVRIDFKLTDLRTGKPIGIVQTGMDYVSTEDPATRGPNGLLRSDDPKNVPPAGQIIRRLIPECAKTMVSMILPANQKLSIALRPTSNEIGQRAISLARKKKYDAALSRASVAVGTESSDALVFNLAVLSEATGHNDDALRYYRDAWELSGKQDMQARQGLRRMERLAMMAEMATTQPASAPASRPAIDIPPTDENHSGELPRMSAPMIPN